jgi:hypothetical protein
MGFVPVNSISASLGSNGGTTGTIDTTGADLIVVHVGKFDGATGGASGGTLSDSKSNAWTPGTLQDGTDAVSRIFFCEFPTVGSGHDFTFSNTSSFSTIEVLAFSGAKIAGSYHSENGATGSGTSLQPGSVTPSENGSLIFTGKCWNASISSLSINSSFTLQEEDPYGAGVNMGAAAAYLIQGTAGAVNPTWSWSGSASAAATIAVFLPEDGGGGGTADVPVGLIDLLSPALSFVKSAAVPISLADLLGTTPTASKSAALGAAPVDVAGTAPAATKSAAVTLGVAELTSPAFAFDQTADAPAAAIDATSPAATSSKSAAVTLGVVEVTAPALEEAGSVQVPAAAVDVASPVVDSSKSAAVPIASADVSSPAIDVAKYAAVVAGVVEVVGISAGTSKSFSLGVCQVDVACPAITTTGGIEVIVAPGLLVISDQPVTVVRISDSAATRCRVSDRAYT